MRFLLGLNLCLVAWAGVGAADAPAAEPAEETVYARIETLRRAAGKLRLDGFDPDWKDFYATVDVKADAGGDAHRDLVAAAIAPTETDVWILLRTAGAPSQERYAYYVFLNLYGDRSNNFKIELVAADEPLVAYHIDGGRLGPKVVLHRARAAIRRVVEMRIPYAELAAAAPEEHASRLAGKTARPWVRMECQTWDGRAQKIVDYGPTVASFRLVPDPALDEPLPERPEPPVTIGLPVRGTWFVSQGSHGSFTHKDTWACDLSRVDATGYFSQPPESRKLEEHYAWNQPVYAPVEGTVLRVRSDIDDSPVHGALNPTAAFNRVYLSHGPLHGVELVHFKRDGVNVRLGERVKAGDVIGASGNSGASDIPHVHVAVWNRRTVRTVPLALGDVRVGLNAAPDDPWARRLKAWEPRKGYFVEPAPSP